MTLTPELKEIALRVAGELAITSMRDADDPDILKFAERFLAALPKPEPVAWYSAKDGIPFGWQEKAPTEDAVFLYAEPPIPKPASEQKPVRPRFDCWSTNEGDSWYEHPADAELLYDVLGNDPKVGDEFEVMAGWCSVQAKYRIVSQKDDDFEVECISHPEDNATPPTPDDTVKVLTNAASDVLAERKRQQEVEGWTPEHDDQHTIGELAVAAACYAAEAGCVVWADDIPSCWPWAQEWWKPSRGDRRNLVKAGALILAEIERLDRVAIAAVKDQ